MHDSFAVLARVAVGLTADARIGLLPSHRRWAWRPSTRTIEVCIPDLRVHGVPGCAGIIAHECGHAWVTRPWRRSVADLGPRMQAWVENALEDPRCEQWIAMRYPGVIPWLAASGALFRRQHLGYLPPVVQLLLGAADPLSLQGPLPDRHLDPQVAQALRETQAARAAYARCLPTADLNGWTDIEGTRHPEHDEAAVRAAAVAAEACATPFVDAVRHQLDQDTRLLARALLVDPAAAREAMSARRWPAVVALAQQGSEAPPTTREEARRLWHRYFQRQRAAVGPADTALGDEDPGPVQDRLPASLVVGRRAEPADRVARMRPLAEALAVALAARFPPRQGRRRRALRSQGTRPHLGAAMRRDADPAASERIWQGSARVEGPEASVMLLVDASGSMEGHGMNHALDGVVLLALAFGALRIDFAVLGFQDRLLPMLPFGAHDEAALEATCQRLSLEAAGTNPNGNNDYLHNDDGPCVEEACHLLCAQASPDRVLLVLSDGSPQGRRSGREELVAVTERWSAPTSPVCLIGVGVGPRSMGVWLHYPHSVVVPDAAELPQRLAQVVGDQLLGL